MHSCISQPEGRANVRRRYQNSVVDKFRARFLSLVGRYRKTFDEERKLELRCKISKLNRHILKC